MRRDVPLGADKHEKISRFWPILAGMKCMGSDVTKHMLSTDVENFLKNKPPAAVALFRLFASQMQTLGPVTLRPTKTTVAFETHRHMAYLYAFGKSFVSGVFRFPRSYEGHLCFFKVAPVAPGAKVYAHYFRLYEPSDLDEELRSFMKLAYDQATPTDA